MAPTPDDMPELSVSPETVCFIIMKAREVDVKDPVTDPDDSSNASDDHMISVLEDHGDDPSRQEIIQTIAALDVDEQVDLVTLAWLGRSDDYTVADWSDVRDEAAAAHNKRTASYLLGMPMLADYLEEGLSMLGLSCAEYEMSHL